jgi:hypothetical protein
VTRGVSKKVQRSDQLRRKRAQADSAWPTAANVPARAVPVPSAAPRPSAPLPAHRYPAKRASLGLRQVPLEAVVPLGRGDK